MLLPILAALAPILTPAPTFALPQDSMSQEELQANMEALDWLEGTVTVEGELATIELPEGWSYLQSLDAQFLVEKFWGNPRDDSILGFVAPPGDAAWGVILSYDDSGYISDDDADDIDYDDLLESMQADTEDANSARESAGFGTVDLLGWAERPHYDHTEKKLYWAKRIEFSGEPGETLNYDIRILGRHGALVMQAVADGSELVAVAQGSKSLLAATQFTEGNRYEEFDSSIDKIAVYGIGGLIAGKVLLKVGIFAKFGKVIALGAVALFAAIKKLFGGSKEGAPRGRSRRN